MKSIFRIGLLGLLLFAVVSSVFAQDSSTPVLLEGTVTDATGEPIAGATVEIWQTDVNGNYDHPNDSDPSVLLPDFQYFGTATTAEDGTYAFLTVKPGAYEPRPSHIHFKVKIDGEEVLTSQFYFEEDQAEVENDGAFNNAGDTLFLQTEDTTDENGDPLRIAIGNIVLNLGDAEATLTPTAAQTEGPYYPVVDFSDYDNNLLSTADDDETIEPIEVATTAEFTLLNLNTASGDEFLTIPNMSNRMVREFNEYRPYISILQFRREIGKYVDDATVAGYEAYVYVPVDVNESDAATLMQIPGVDEAIAQQLIDARPFADYAAFLDMLATAAPEVDITYATNFLGAG
ncbi:MAG: carboxypeptidase regulatory-like domain-containing protein [Anaerolineae bacterium]|nr:carboxypeptidase regulatory-like domain-containing protein [Anaerolineae bacterium]